MIVIAFHLNLTIYISGLTNILEYKKLINKEEQAELDEWKKDYASVNTY